MKILIADDEVTSRFVLEANLKQWGFEVEAHENGASVWNRLQEPDAPKLLILDWVMPGMTGVEVCRRLRAIRTSSPAYLIFLTALEDKARIVEGLDAGANDYITKPFHATELYARVQAGIRVITLQNDLNQHVAKLEEALGHIKRLEGLIPICSYCHKIRNLDHHWEQLERYIMSRTDAQFSHGICPNCRDVHFPRRGYPKGDG